MDGTSPFALFIKCEHDIITCGKIIWLEVPKLFSELQEYICFRMREVRRIR